MAQYFIRTEYIAVKIRVVADSPEDAEEIGSDFTDSLVFDDKTLRKRAKEINCPECYYLGCDSTGDSEVSVAPDHPSKN
jgi:hypothetical protein